MIRVRGLAGLAVASALLLTGCGSASGPNPGVAVRVGDTTYSTSRVHDTATEYCGASLAGQDGSSAVPNHYISGYTAGALALRSAADQMMAKYDVDADASYDQTIDAAQSQLAALTDAQAKALVEVGAASIYVQAAERSVGRVVDSAATDDDAAQKAGAKVFKAWIADHDVRIDPRYGVTVAGGAVAAADTGVSFAVSDIATKAAAESPETTYAGTLPETQRCG